ncbi:hypothetical protein [Limnobacter parvus]|uniref:HPt domain-containing protein n=1 Tax=Limnobacter parvus TaxID=2939690 RepID=A0ABT1XJF0_9BURK|nr:hypothetical protein [Limnobacter parvus]MCR2747413.1 hypothetical protein [Limnobacter parvus]
MDLSSLASEVELESTLDRVCDDKALLVELLGMLVDDFKGEQAEFIAHLENEDYPWLRSKAHHHKGIGANLGLLNFMAAAKSLETFAQLANQAKCKEAFQEMLNTVLHVEELLTNLAEK